MKNEKTLLMNGLLRKGTLFLLLQGFLLSVTAAGFAAISPRNNSVEASLENEADITVKGIINDESDMPLPGVTITLRGTSTGTVTDVNGAYSIVAPDNGTLVFSFIGFKTQTIDIGNRSIINLTMVEDIGALNEVVVTSLGVTREQRSIGYATSTIGSDELVKVGTPNIATALYGKAPGVRIQSGAGGATSAVNITVRGINSITGRNQPLIILDGVPIRNEEVNNNNYWGDQRLRGNGLLDINPEDVDNISILKGASAAALYGSEAVNGVVLITTKKGTSGKKALV